MREMAPLTWDEIYNYWRICAFSGPTVLKNAVEPVEIPVEWRESGCFYGYDWLSQAEFAQRKKTIETNPVQFFLFTKPTNKGTIHTLNMLVDAENEEERAAIWIYAYANELYESSRNTDVCRYARLICDAAWTYLADKFYMWHHAMKRLTPEIFTDDDVLEELQITSFKPVVALARVNAALVMYEYVPVLYSSLEPGTKKADASLRLKKRS